MMFRAMGDHKPFTGDVDEIQSFKAPHRTAGKAFSLVHPMAHEVAAKEIKKHLTDSVIDATIHEHGLGSNVAATLKKRRDLLLAHYGQL